MFTKAELCIRDQKQYRSVIDFFVRLFDRSIRYVIKMQKAWATSVQLLTEYISKRIAGIEG